MKSKKYDMETRLLKYTASIVRVVEKMVKTKSSNLVGAQLLRAGTSTYFNHGEAKAAESPRDFVHKLELCLKGLRDTKRALMLTRQVPLMHSLTELDALQTETDQLIRIFCVSIRTANRSVMRESASKRYADNPREQNSAPRHCALHVER